MILFVDAEHESGFDKPWGEFLLAGRTRITYRLEDISGHTCLLQRYTQVDPDLIHRHGIQAVFISGSSTDPDQYDLADQEGLREVVRSRVVPVFGFCGGWQLMAESLGSKIEKIGHLRDGEEDPDPDFMPGFRTETGYEPVTTLDHHPLLEGLGDDPVFRHYHGWEIKQLPTGFSNHARTAISEHQLVVDDGPRFVGTQFHPEYYTDKNPAGRVLIENFCNWAGLGS